MAAGRPTRAAINAATLVAFSKVGIKLVGVFAGAAETIFEALADRRVSPGEGENIAVKALKQENLSLRWKGRDVIDDQAQDHLVRFFGRVAANIFEANRGMES